jgi:ribosomal protein S18 acetylase RimI-like enzyme
MSPKLLSEIHTISPSQVQDFRYHVLQPDDKAHSVYKFDDAPKTLHLGAFVGDELVSIATICRQPMPNSEESSEWRLRGMATKDTFRRQGLGRQLAENCLAYALSEGGSLVWCYSRQSAVSFYRSLGFKEEGAPFSLLEYSSEPYFLMRLRLPKSR